MNDPRNVHHHDGPVFNGAVSGTQFAWNNQSVTQNQQNNSTVAPGFEALAALVDDLLRQLPGAGLADRDREDVEAAAGEVRATISGPDTPEEGRVRRALAMLRGVLAPVAAGVAAGTAAGAQEWAQTAIEGLSRSI
ncbi:hypothetical protein ACFY9Q_27045 [Streptomyces sp. NPDC012389]|uniref:hypothetical protein n=1 Tax=unclassified Streptomyces TaxID=2593676 RepID=UPI00081D682C|nr:MULTISPECIES: hypothetical protein [unclassified Streptomyces]MYR94614.1 hypothetical protein [Streptomyces sp. SID4937]SCD74448.1 hypothetical protein GA0115243_1039225 [Streptomyces sp. ScaeMP-e83]